MKYPLRAQFLAVVGLSPQVVTESLYALWQIRDSQPFPEALHIVTTTEGALRVRRCLLPDADGWLAKLIEEYEMPPIRFDESQIHIVNGPDDRPLSDIRSQQDNVCASDQINSLVASLTSDSEVALHASIAGGRKTMGFILGYAMMMFGRHCDHLSHVLVSEPFESLPEFFYPSRGIRLLRVGGEHMVDAMDATITLADIPIVSLRNRLPVQVLKGSAGFDSTIQAARRSLEAAHLTIDIEQKCYIAAGVKNTLGAAELALLLLFAKRAISNAPALPAPPKGAPDQALAHEYLAARRQLAGKAGDIERAERAYQRGLDGDAFASMLSRLRRKMREQLGALVMNYQIDDGGAKPFRYRLLLEPDQIEITE